MEASNLQVTTDVKPYKHSCCVLLVSNTVCTLINESDPKQSVE